MSTWRPPISLRGVVVLASAITLAACTSAAPESEDPAPVESPEEPEEPTPDAPETPDTPESREVEIIGFEVDETVYFSGIEYRFGSLHVTDLDEEAGLEPGEPRVRGLELDFDVDAYNPYDDSVVPGSPIALRWQETGTENTAEIPGRAEFNQVPGKSSTTGEISFEVSPDHLETYDPDSAHLVFGTGQEANAVLPLGAGTELVTLFPVVQEHLVGEQIDTGPVTFTFDDVQVRWNFGTTNQGQAGKDEVLVVFEMSGENTSDSNICGRRSAGKSMFLRSADGQGYVDEGVSQRCYDAGETLRNVTGFVVDADYEGTYTVEYDFDPVGNQEAKGEIEIELIAGEGQAPSTME